MFRTIFVTGMVLLNSILITEGIDTTGPSDQPIAVNPANLPGGTIAVEFVPGPFFQDFQPPFPTNAWWSGLTLGWQSNVLAGPFPFMSKTENAGLQFGVPENRRFDGISIHQDPSIDWQAGFTGIPDNIAARKATYWDTQTICLQYFSGASQMNSCLSPGSPYITLKYNNAAPVFSSLMGPITDFAWIAQGSKFKATTSVGTYVFYALDGDLDIDHFNVSLTSLRPYNGIIRIAKLIEPNQEAILDAHVSAVPNGIVMEYSVQGDMSEQTWTWTIERGNPDDLLVLCWPHHRKVLVNPNYVQIEYMTIKGKMRGVKGNVWVQRHILHKITWNTANAPHSSCTTELNRTLQYEVDHPQLGFPGNYYFWGGEFARAAQLATIAEHIGRTDLIPKVLETMKIVEAVFDPNHPELLAYETGWGGIVDREDINSQMFNDHHFTYAYSLHGAAVIGKYDPSWLQQHKDFFLQLARSIANPSPNDPHYTVARHMDFFHGHSWASGLGNSAGARAQESSSEAINAYYSLVLFADAIGDQHLLDFSRMLLAIEIAGAIQYWHLYPTVTDEDSPYPEQDFRNLVSVGNLLDASVGAWLYWGGQRIQIAAIQLLPLTPIGQDYFDVPWMEQVLEYCMEEIEDLTIGDSFKSVIVAAYATVNPQRAYTLSQEIADWGGGNSWTNSLYFISTQQSPNAICDITQQSPEGFYLIQDVASGKYITLGTDSKLTAAATVDVMANKFKLAFKPGGGTLQALVNGKYVTADNSGEHVLAATKDEASSYELFRWYPQPNENYFLRALSNKGFVGSDAEGDLKNNGTVSEYKLIPANGDPLPPPPAQGKLRNIQTNNFVMASQLVPLLYVGNTEEDATIWSFERVPESPDASPLYGIRNTVTNLYVTADPTGFSPLSASSGAVNAWEQFQLLPYNGIYIIIHSITGKAVAAQPDQTLIDNNLNIDTSAQWAIV